MNSSGKRVRTLASHEYRAAVRSRVLLVFVAILLIATVVSVYIASVRYAAQLADYRAYRAAAQANGLPRIAPSPFAAMALLRGALEYLEIIGSVIAITLGYLSVTRERSSRTLSLIYSRPVSGGELAAGSMLGAVGVLGTLVATTALVGILCVGIIGNDWINGTQLLKLLLACVAAVIFLSAFYALGVIATTRAKVGANGLMVALGIWLLVVLVLPQIGDTLDADNQVPGGLFAALALDHNGEVAILQHFVGYERTRTWIEDASLAKHFERFAFAMTDVKERYRPYGIGRLIHETRVDIAWMAVYAVALFVGLRRTLTRQAATTQGESS
jgi:ABC-type transport system involved in multi-copper enzyme maturation permease subunit